MRNKYQGICYSCGTLVKPKAGHFERYMGGWRVKHAECAITDRAMKIDKDSLTPPNQEE